MLIDGNTTKSNGSRGIFVTRGTISAFPPSISLAGVTNNNASSNTGDGIFINSNIPGLSTPVAGNQADKNGANGIHINSSGYVLSNNKASSNGACGIIAVSGNTNGGGNTGKKNATCDVSIP